MNLTVLAPSYYTSWYPTRYLQYSAQRYSIPITWYGSHKPYPGWFGIQIIDLLEELSEVDTSHVLYTDASDAIFLSDLSEVACKYVDMDVQSGILISRECSGVCAGGIMAETDVLYQALAQLALYSIDDPDSSNPQVRWRAAIADNYVQADIDEQSNIFQVVDEPLAVMDGRVYNTRTGNYPSILHFAGGYTDPAQGKAALIEPYWKRLGY